MNKSHLLAAVCACLSAVSFNTSAALIERLGGLAYYDDVADLTWLADANYAQTSGYVGDGNMNWADANAWAAGLNVGGVTGWRLPDTNPIDGTTADDTTFVYDGSEDRGYNVSAPGTLYAGSTASEMAHLFYNTLGNLGYCDPVTSSTSSCSGPQTGWGLSNPGPFSNLQPSDYWSATERGSNDDAWVFSFINGKQSYDDTEENDSNNFAWAVHAGDVGAVPVPAAVWLFGSGLLGLIGIARRKKAA